MADKLSNAERSGRPSRSLSGDRRSLSASCVTKKFIADHGSLFAVTVIIEEADSFNHKTVTLSFDMIFVTKNEYKNGIKDLVRRFRTT